VTRLARASLNVVTLHLSAGRLFLLAAIALYVLAVIDYTGTTIASQQGGTWLASGLLAQALDAAITTLHG
jgi:hypothetical protein